MSTIASALPARLEQNSVVTNGMKGAEWDNAAVEPCEGSAQVLDCIGLNGGPCRDRTYDQLIKSGHFELPIL
jgi:hypothetical protein